MIPMSGELLVGRFAVESVAGGGGMGTVLRARDLLTERMVAIKLLHVSSFASHKVDRFSREAQLLSEMNHPNIVGYVTHGVTPDGQHFLAMEWLDGEDLSERLKRGPLTIRETILLLRQSVAALSAAHRHGVVHRDLKPSNLFLPGGDIARLKLLDFGIARRMAASQVMTRTGLIIGTPEYMAPEQARGEREITAAADIFSLGCVLYECLAGQPPFKGEHVAAVLMRILFESPPALAMCRPGIPEPLIKIIDHMLQKDPAQRPGDVDKILELLPDLGAFHEQHPPPTVSEEKSPISNRFDGEEQELLCVVVAGAPPDATDVAGVRLEAVDGATQRRELQVALCNLRARVEWLLDGVLVATFSGLGSAQDQAAVAARAALLLRERWPSCVVAMATGRAAVLGNLAVGEAVDQAVRILQHQFAQAGRAANRGVWLDAVSAGLLARRFALTQRDGFSLLSGEELPADEAHMLLGRPTPCVGREQDLALLDVLINGCIGEPMAQAVLITAPSGAGKSHLTREFLRRLALRSEAITIIGGYGDPLTGGSPYDILRSALRRHCGLYGSRNATPLDQQRAAFTRVLSSFLPDREQQQALAFLGELCGVPFPDENLPALRAARCDPKIMSDQLAEALITLFRSACAQGPVILLLDDLQWADALTLKLVGALIRELSDQPLLLLAMGRPDVHERFPKLWAGLGVREVPLGALSRKACERLIQAVLGKGLSPEMTARLSDQAAGNVLFLEELIRAAAAGQVAELPATLLAILQARIGQLESDARRTIRAASIFGLTFWRGGVQALLNPERSSHDLDQGLRQLLESELIQLRTDSRLAGDQEYVFRNALTREAAYSLLKEEDRSLGHRRAAEFLEPHLDTEPLVLAQHYEHGNVREKAAAYYLRAGLQSFECYDLEEVLVRAGRGLASAEPGQTMGELRTLLAIAHCWRSELSAAFAHVIACQRQLQPGSRWECAALFHGMWAALVTNQESEFAALASGLCEFQPASPEAVRDLVLWGSLGASLLTSYARRKLAGTLLSRAESTLAITPELSQANDLRGALRMGQSDYVRAFEADPFRPLLLSQEAVTAFAEIGDRRDQVTAMTRLGQAQGELGDFAEGERTLRDAAALARRIRIPFAVLQTELHLAALLCTSSLADRQSEATALVKSILGTQGLSAGYIGWCHGILSTMAIEQKQWQVAIDAAKQAVSLCGRVPLRLLWTRSLLVRSLLGAQQLDAAHQEAEDMLQSLVQSGGGGYVEIGVRAAALAAFVACGQTARADVERQLAQTQLTLRAEKIPTADKRQLYLNSQPLYSE